MAAAETRKAITSMAQQAFRVAQDACYNLKDFLSTSSMWAFRSVQDCERELDQIELQIDDRLPGAISGVSEKQARVLLACLRVSLELERVGDVVLSATLRLHRAHPPLPAADLRQIASMTALLDRMLKQADEGFRTRDPQCATTVLRLDIDMDKVRSVLMRPHLRKSKTGNDQQVALLLVVQALERAGDHATNIAEELLRLIEGRSYRHVSRRTTFRKDAPVSST